MYKIILNMVLLNSYKIFVCRYDYESMYQKNNNMSSILECSSLWVSLYSDLVANWANKEWFRAGPTKNSSVLAEKKL